jgi:hypothetical protein
MTRPLSPAAQAVINEAAKAVLAHPRLNLEHIAAAAICAAADQVVSQDGWIGLHPEAAETYNVVRSELLAIATELDPPSSDEDLSTNSHP